MNAIADWFGRYGFLLPRLGDLIQIVLVAVGVYYVLRLLARTRAMQMLFGFLLLAAIYFASRFLGLSLIGTILEYGFQYGAIAALIIFQPELRSALARLGQSRMLRLFPNKMEQSELVEELVEGVQRLSRAKIGGIIALQRDVGLDEYADTGTRIHARGGHHREHLRALRAAPRWRDPDQRRYHHCGGRDPAVDAVPRGRQEPRNPTPGRHRTVGGNRCPGDRGERGDFPGIHGAARSTRAKRLRRTAARCVVGRGGGRGLTAVRALTAFRAAGTLARIPARDVVRSVRMHRGA